MDWLRRVFTPRAAAKRKAEAGGSGSVDLRNLSQEPTKAPAPERTANATRANQDPASQSSFAKHTRQELTDLRDQLQGEEAWVGLAEELVEAGLTEEEAVEAGVSKRVTDSMGLSMRSGASIRNQSLRSGHGDVSSRSMSLRRAAGDLSVRGGGRQKWLGLGTRLDELALGEESEDQLSEMASDALKAARLIKMLALEIDYDDVELDLSEEPS